MLVGGRPFWQSSSKNERRELMAELDMTDDELPMNSSEKRVRQILKNFRSSSLLGVLMDVHAGRVTLTDMPKTM